MSVPQDARLPHSTWPVSAPPRRKSDRARAAIVGAALEFLRIHPFREMTVGTLMAATPLSRPAFYQYFHDVHHLMERLLLDLEAEILRVAAPWFTGTGDAVPLLQRSLAGLVRVGHELGSLLRAVADAAPTDERLDRAWSGMLGRFDDAVAARIAADQAQGLIPWFDARPVAVALNRLDAYMLIHAFGGQPHSDQAQVLDALTRLWMSTLYGMPTDGLHTPRIRRTGPASARADR